MASSLWLLLDDMAAMLDDVAVMTKVAAKKTAGVLGDDLALNAHQVSGVASKRELPIVWKVFVGSSINKVILVPLFLLIIYFAPWAIKPILLVGGLYLCFEGVEKLAHKYLHKEESQKEGAALHLAMMSDQDMAAFEKDKIKGAVRTDLILSAEILAIALGSMSLDNFAKVATALSLLAVVFTVGVYAVVALIVKLDDMGAWLVLKKHTKATVQLGLGLLATAPYLMKFLSFAGTVAMFLVGGGIVLHSFPIGHTIEAWIPQSLGLLRDLGLMSINGVIGVIAGAIVLAVVTGSKKLFKKKPA